MDTGIREKIQEKYGKIATKVSNGGKTASAARPLAAVTKALPVHRSTAPTLGYSRYSTST